MEAGQQATESENLVVGDGADQFLTFILAGEEYGVDILRVQEIKGWDKPTPIPNTPDYIKGVMNLRGTIVPIVDLRQRFGLEVLEYGPTTVVIVLRIMNAERERIMGVVVDAVSEVYNIDAETVQDPPELGRDLKVAFVRGLATVDDKMVILLDIDHLMNPDELAVMNATAQ